MKWEKIFVDEMGKKVVDETASLRKFRGNGNIPKNQGNETESKERDRQTYNNHRYIFIEVQQTPLFLVLPIDVFDLLDLLWSIMFPHPAVLLANILYTSDSFTCAPNGNQSFQF